METKEQEAKEAWREYTNKRFYDVSEGKNGAVKGSYQLTAISDFQSVIIDELKSKIEHYKNIQDEYLEGTIAYSNVELAILENEKFISLVKTVTPKKK